MRMHSSWCAPRLAVALEHLEHLERIRPVNVLQLQLWCGCTAVTQRYPDTAEVLLHSWLRSPHPAGPGHWDQITTYAAFGAPGAYHPIQPVHPIPLMGLYSG